MLALFGLNFSSGTNLDHSDAACKLGKAFLELFAVIIRVGVLDLRTDLSNAGIYIFLSAGAGNDSCFILGNNNLGSMAEDCIINRVKLKAKLIRYYLGTGKDSHILQHCLAAVAEARGFYSYRVESTADLVKDEGRQCFTVNIFSNDEERLA